MRATVTARTEERGTWQYYPHGPLERTELGAHVVQGTDYAYTLQGWLKGINGDRLDQRTDMGRDGDPSLSPNPNLNVGRDAYALSLGYYGDSDYKGIGSAWDDDQPASIAQRPFAPMGMPGIGSTLATQHKPLHNGNIAHTVNTLQPFGTWSANGGQAQVLAQVYAYDQLNRLQKSRGIIGLGASNNWEGITDANAWRYVSEYGYDANGNITDCDRYTGDTGLRYDVLRYKYQKQQGSGRLLRNRLYHVHSDHDNLATTDIGDYADDLANFNDPHNTNGTINTANPYGYDALGNLTRNTHDGISAIDWTVAGKVKAVHRAGGSPLLKLNFGYGASGQRIMKQVGEPGTDAGAYREHYIRDAQGNIMATYRYTNDASVSLLLNERPLYGSSRLGSLRKEVEVYNAPTSVQPGANPTQLVDLNYELTDHLGNVSAVVTGRLLTNLFGATPCQAELVSATGYEPFGSLLPGRNYSSDSYRFGFNGKENDNEVHGAVGTMQDYGMRMYDSRIGRFPTTDPLSERFPWLSTYQFAGNSPIWAIDIDGLEQGVVIRWYDNQQNWTGSTAFAVTSASDRPLGQANFLFLNLPDNGSNRSSMESLMSGVSRATPGTNMPTLRSFLTTNAQGSSQPVLSDFSGNSVSLLNQAGNLTAGVAFVRSALSQSDLALFTNVQTAIQNRPDRPAWAFDRPTNEVIHFQFGSSQYDPNADLVNDGEPNGLALQQAIAKLQLNPDKVATITGNASIPDQTNRNPNLSSDRANRILGLPALNGVRSRITSNGGAGATNASGTNNADQNATIQFNIPLQSQ